MEVKLKWNGQMGFSGQGRSGHQVTMDAADAVGGSNQGPRPTELLLMALAGCTGMDVVSILRKMQIPFTDLTIAVEGRQAEQHPRYFTQVELVYWVQGRDLPRDRVERAVQLSQEKYCTVSHSLSGQVDITYRVELVAE